MINAGQGTVANHKGTCLPRMPFVHKLKVVMDLYINTKYLENSIEARVKTLRPQTAHRQAVWCDPSPLHRVLLTALKD